jgi:hypothetical protein
MVKTWWVPIYPDSSKDSLVEVGGSKVFVGFELGSQGTFWKNQRGEDRITINCPGLVLESDKDGRFAKAELDSVETYGKQELKLSDNKFVNRGNARTILNEQITWNAYPRMILDLNNIFFGETCEGLQYYIPKLSIINTSQKRLFLVRVKSKKLFSRYPGYYCDFYIMEHSFDTKNFTQNLKLRSKNPY